MTTKRLASVFVVAGVVTFTTLVLPSPSGESREVQAGIVSHTQDSDKDCLPDVLEQMLMANPALPDSDGDLVGDLDEFIAGSHLWLGSSQKVVDQGMCLAVTTQLITVGPIKERVFWAHLAFKVASGKLTDLNAIHFFGHVGGTVVSLNQFIQDPRNCLNIKIDNRGALMGVLSIRVGLGPSLYPCEITKPFQFCGGGLIGNTPYLSANYMFPSAGTYLSLMPFMPGGLLAFLPMNPAGSQLQVWESACEICVVTQSVAGVTPGHVIYEITSAKCTRVSLPKACKPGCETMTGSIVVGLDGWSLVGA